MKRKKAIVIIGVLLFFLALVFLNYQYEEKEETVPYVPGPPALLVQLGEAETNATKEEACWRAIKYLRCAAAHPIVEVGKGADLKGEPAASVTLWFDTEPASLEAELIGEGKQVLDQYLLTLPQQPGIYYYHISAEWERGHGKYTFSVEVIDKSQAEEAG